MRTTTLPPTSLSARLLHKRARALHTRLQPADGKPADIASNSTTLTPGTAAAARRQSRPSAVHWKRIIMMTVMLLVTIFCAAKVAEVIVVSNMQHWVSQTKPQKSLSAPRLLHVRQRPPAVF
ncbi:hypothetical protein [Pseudomethylobacillus aquaticus]|nr:hypothetical protein [Pseudomethylobacillus aquaticus]